MSNHHIAEISLNVALKTSVRNPATNKQQNSKIVQNILPQENLSRRLTLE